mgnify:FL=1
MNTDEILEALDNHIKAVEEHITEVKDLVAKMFGLLFRSSLNDEEIPDTKLLTKIPTEVNNLFRKPV